MKSSGNGVVSVPVPGGSLAVELVTADTEPLLVIHGISSQRRLWNWLHAADMIAVLDQLGMAATHVCGMSIDGFVAAPWWQWGGWPALTTRPRS
jgi:hypothetical protein